MEAATRRPRHGRPNNRGRCKKTQANGRLQRWNSKGLRPEGLVEAAARDSEDFRGWNGFKGFKKAYSRAWWKVPPGIRSILRFFKGFKRLKAGKRQA